MYILVYMSLSSKKKWPKLLQCFILTLPYETWEIEVWRYWKESQLEDLSGIVSWMLCDCFATVLPQTCKDLKWESNDLLGKDQYTSHKALHFDAFCNMFRMKAQYITSLLPSFTCITKFLCEVHLRSFMAIDRNSRGLFLTFSGLHIKLICCRFHNESISISLPQKFGPLWHCPQNWAHWIGWNRNWNDHCDQRISGFAMFFHHVFYLSFHPFVPLPNFIKFHIFPSVHLPSTRA